MLKNNLKTKKQQSIRCLDNHVRKPVKFSLVWFTLLSFGGEDLFPQTWFHVCIGTAAHQALVQYSAG